MTTTTLKSHEPIAAAKAGVGFELALDQAIYEPATEPGDINATLFLRCQAGSPLSLTFITGQEFDLQICDAAGKQVALWSAGRMFPDVVQTITVDGERVWKAAMPLPLLPGTLSADYIATAYLMASEPGIGAGGPGGVVHPGEDAGEKTAIGLVPPAIALHAYSATVRFTVRAHPVVLMAQPA